MNWDSDHEFSWEWATISFTVDRQNSWFNLTFDEVENRLGDLVKFPGSMNLDEYSQVCSMQILFGLLEGILMILPLLLLFSIGLG